MTEKKKLEEAKRLYQTANADQRYVLESLFPELAESEDERIRGAIIDHLKDNNLTEWAAWLKKQGQIEDKTYKENNESLTSEDKNILKAIIYTVKNSGYNHCIGVSNEEMIAWLEKQGEKKETLCDKCKKAQPSHSCQDITALGRCYIDAINTSSNKVEPKFHEGKWIIHQGTENIYQVVARIGNQYQLKYGDNYTIQKCADVDRCARLWDITKDAKDGDVLCYKDEISLYKHDIKNCTKQETTFGGFTYHCCYDGKRFITDSLYSLTEQDKTDIHPATKEQRELLFQKMHEAGYEWNDENKELKRIEKSSAWSEEDEAGLGDALWAIEQAKTIVKMKTKWVISDMLKGGSNL